MNAHCERVTGTIRPEALDYVPTVTETHARQVLAEYRNHYNQHRPHRSRDQRPPEAQEHPAHPCTSSSSDGPCAHTRPRRINQRVPIRHLICSNDFPSPTGSASSTTLGLLRR
ncbi:integrase core domain-containing protein [Streptomyces sp. NPDC057684]|uniref:integrase core domain-containing protein n=1 Tax=Streptomyces sp. NPDC057684 TaxID=3346211 RepID=UPI0036A7FAC5